LRLYGDADREAVEAMQAHVAAGLSPAEAARAVRERTPRADPRSPDGLDAASRRLRSALDGFEESPAHTELDRLLSAFGTETVVTEVILPYLRELGERWACGEATVAQEHFSSAVVHGRLVGLARGWDAGFGPRALLACAPGELHTLGLVCFALLLRGEGWRVTYLGADTPLSDLAAAAGAIEPAAVVVSAVDGGRFRAAGGALRAAARSAPLAIGGAGADDGAAGATGALRLDEDPRTAARELTARFAK
jgi:hypothetical protein